MDIDRDYSIDSANFPTANKLFESEMEALEIDWNYKIRLLVTLCERIPIEKTSESVKNMTDQLYIVVECLKNPQYFGVIERRQINIVTTIFDNIKSKLSKK
jgi:hypothetical protein